MKSLINFALSLAALFIYTNCDAQIKNAKTESVKIYGNCGMCEKTIETAAYKKGEAKADWDQDSKMAQITYDPGKTNLDAVLQRIAAAGYDSDKFKATNDAYGNLHSCCKYDRPAGTTGAVTPPVSEQPLSAPPAVATSGDMPKEAGKMVKKQANSVPAPSPLTDVYNAYFGLKDALVATDGKAASKQGEALFTAIGNVKRDAFTTTQHNIWMKYQSKLSADAQHIKDVTDTEHQREHFVSLSNNMYEVMKVIKPDTTVYLEFCPMYNDGQGGNWLSTEKAIKNPYYGKKMMTCGSVTETLK
jgi:copper chaperone CopZ